MARVLVVYKEFPSPQVGHAGGRAVSRVIEFLHRQGHQVSLVTRVRAQEQSLLEAMRDFCDPIYTVPHHTASSLPWLLAFPLSYLALRRTFKRALAEIEPDLVHIEVTQTAFTILGLGKTLTSFRPLDVNWFLFQQQAASAHGVRRWALRIAAKIFSWLEPWICRQYDLIEAISQGDRQLLAPHCPDRPVLLLPLSPSFPYQHDHDVSPAVSLGPNVLFVGALYRPFNVQGVLWFLDHVWPLVLNQIPNARFYVVGYDPTPEILERHDGKHVFIVGYAQDLAGWYSAAQVAVSPLLVAGGLLQKVLDAFSTGTAVVATTVSNHGVGAADGEHLFLADDASRFAQRVVDLLCDQGLCSQIGLAGQQFVNERYDLDSSLLLWEKTWLQRLQEDLPNCTRIRKKI